MAVADVRAQIAEVETAYDEAVSRSWLLALGRARSDAADLFRQFFAALDALGDDLAVAITDEPASVAFATTRVPRIRREFSTTVAGLLGITLILPIGDGD